MLQDLHFADPLVGRDGGHQLPEAAVAVVHIALQAQRRRLLAPLAAAVLGQAPQGRGAAAARPPGLRLAAAGGPAGTHGFHAAAGTERRRGGQRDAPLLLRPPPAPLRAPGSSRPAAALPGRSQHGPRRLCRRHRPRRPLYGTGGRGGLRGGASQPIRAPRPPVERGAGQWRRARGGGGAAGGGRAPRRRRRGGGGLKEGGGAVRGRKVRGMRAAPASQRPPEPCPAVGSRGQRCPASPGGVFCVPPLAAPHRPSAGFGGCQQGKSQGKLEGGLGSRAKQRLGTLN